MALNKYLWAIASLIVLAAGGLLDGTTAALVFITATSASPTRPGSSRTSHPTGCAAAYFALGSMSWTRARYPRRRRPAAPLAPFAVWPLAAGVCVFSAFGCLTLPNTPEGMRRTPRPDRVTVTPLTPALRVA